MDKKKDSKTSTELSAEELKKVAGGRGGVNSPPRRGGTYN
jgi:hypothetical protein